MAFNDTTLQTFGQRLATMQCAGSGESLVATASQVTYVAVPPPYLASMARIS
jgi:hypothetical protein